MVKVVKSSKKASKPVKTQSAKAEKGDGEKKVPKFRGRRGKTLNLPAYACWVHIFDLQRKVADGKPQQLGKKTIKKPLTDEQIIEFLNDEYADAPLKEASPNGVDRLRSLYNRGKINKQDGPPKKPVGEFDENGEEKIRTRGAGKKKANKDEDGKAAKGKAKTKAKAKDEDEEEEEEEDEESEEEEEEEDEE